MCSNNLRKSIYPLFLIIASVVILITGLLLAKLEIGKYYIIGILFFLIIFGYMEKIVFISLYVFLTNIVFLGLIYLITRETKELLPAFIRINTTFLAVIPGMGVSTKELANSLHKLKINKKIILGLIITYNFIPKMREEMKIIKESIKTRNLKLKFYNPKIYYRAYFIPLLIRIIKISDTLSLSIETRNFDFDSKKVTIYNDTFIKLRDILFLVILLLMSIGGILVGYLL